MEMGREEPNLYKVVSSSLPLKLIIIITTVVKYIYVDKMLQSEGLSNHFYKKYTSLRSIAFQTAP